MKDRQVYSISDGTNECIQRVSPNIEKMDGGMYLLMSSICFDPEKRTPPLYVQKSPFMQSLRENPEVTQYDNEDKIVHAFMAHLK